VGLGYRCGYDLTQPRSDAAQIATALAHWATPHYRRTARKDFELSDEPEDLMEDFNRYCFMSVFFTAEMVMPS